MALKGLSVALSCPDVSMEVSTPRPSILSYECTGAARTALLRPVRASPSPRRPACSFPFHLQCEIVAGAALTPGIKRSAIEIWCAPLDDRISFTRRKEEGGSRAGFNGPTVHITVRALVHFVQACDKEEGEKRQKQLLEIHLSNDWRSNQLQWFTTACFLFRKYKK